MAKKQTKIGRALMLVVCACAIPAGIAALVGLIYHYTHTKSELYAASVRRAASVSANVDSVIHGVEIGLWTLAESSALKTADLSTPAELRKFGLQAAAARQHIDGARNIYLTDPTGRQVSNTLWAFGAPLPVTGNVELVQRVVATGRPQISDVFIGAVNNVPVVAVAVPIIRQGQVKAVLGATIMPDKMAALLIRQHAPASWYISVLDSQSRFIARSHDVARFLGQNASDDIRQAMARGPSGTLRARTREGIAILAAHTRSSYTGWTVAVGIPEESALRELNWSLAAVAGAALCVVGLGLTASMLLARRIEQAISSLIPAAEALSRSEALALPVQTFVETQQVADALQRTSEKLLKSEHDAQHDALTGLPNRAFMRAVLPRYRAHTLRHKSTLALLYIDLDGFKQVNDELGHAAGDAVLIEAAVRLRAQVRTSDVCVRLGGDEFAVLLLDTKRGGAQHIADKLMDALARDIHTVLGRVNVSASIGIAVLPDDTLEIDELIEKADLEMYRRKRQRKRDQSGPPTLTRVS